VKIIRFLDADGATRLGAADPTSDVSTAAPPATARLIEGSLTGSYRVTDATARVAKLLYPIEPPMILGIGANYRAVFTSSGRPLPDYPIVFFKLANALASPGDPIVLPRTAIRADEVKYEGELCVVIGRGGKNIPASRAMEHVLGYTIANDVSGSDWQGARVGMQWAKGKGFDTFCPLGPAIVTADEIGDPATCASSRASTVPSSRTSRSLRWSSPCPSSSRSSPPATPSPTAASSSPAPHPAPAS
jgi:2-keto-4-pentenoate hydratase/2-oxohepta-3-ene-1,7-dioic acid hydratase in catechol pathway